MPTQMVETVVACDGADDEANGSEPMPVMQALIAATRAHPHQGTLLGLSADPEQDGYTLHQLDGSLFDPSTHGLLLRPRVGGAPWTDTGAMRLYALEPDACKSDVVSKLGHVAAQIEAGGRELLGAVMFTCSGRTEGFFGEPAFDATAFARRFGRASLIGMYAGGEIGPKALADAPPSLATQVGHASMQGFTAVYGLFTVPKPSASPLELSVADDDALGAAFAHMRLQPAASAAAAAAAAVAAATAERGLGRRSPEDIVASLSKLSAGKLRKLLTSLGLEFVSGLEKKEYVEQIAAHEDAEEALLEYEEQGSAQPPIPPEVV